MPDAEPSPSLPPALVPLALGLVIGGLVAIGLAWWLLQMRAAAEARAVEAGARADAVGAVDEARSLAEADAVLDRLHRAAATADLEGYFGLFTEDAVFIGTDATERWTTTEFRAYAAPHFEGESAWTYEPLERHVHVDGARGTAWFDERLDNAKYGEARGSGVLVRRDGEWRVAQYVLSFPIPNAIAADVTALARDAAGGDE